MPSFIVPSGDGHVEIPLGRYSGKRIKSLQVYQTEESLNLDLIFEDKSMLEMIFEVGFHGSLKLYENRQGDYHLVEKIKPRRKK